MVAGLEQTAVLMPVSCTRQAPADLMQCRPGGTHCTFWMLLPVASQGRPSLWGDHLWPFRISERLQTQMEDASSRIGRCHAGSDLPIPLSTGFCICRGRWACVWEQILCRYQGPAAFLIPTQVHRVSHMTGQLCGCSRGL